MDSRFRGNDIGGRHGQRPTRRPLFCGGLTKKYFPVKVVFMDKAEREILERTACAAERVVALLEKQQPSLIERIITMFSSAATICGFIAVIDILMNWFGE